MEKLRGKKPVARDHYPMLVTFDDIAKPETVKQVDPDDLAATFGPGYALKQVSLELTDEPVTEGEIEEILGWLEEHYNNRLDGNRYGTIESTSRFANSLASGSFCAGCEK